MAGHGSDVEPLIFQGRNFMKFSVRVAFAGTLALSLGLVTMNPYAEPSRIGVLTSSAQSQIVKASCADQCLNRCKSRGPYCLRNCMNNRCK